MQTRQLDSVRAPPPVAADVTRMWAMVQDRYGSAPEDVLRLAEIDRPTIGDEEVLLRVNAAGVDRGTWHIMAGLPYPVRLMGYGIRRPKDRVRGREVSRTFRARAEAIAVRRQIEHDDLVGVASGATGNPAILVYSTKMAPTERPDIGYAICFPVTTIVKIIAVQVLAASYGVAPS